MDEQYFIKSGYSTNVKNGGPKDTYTKAPVGTHYQVAVYKNVRNYILRNRVKNVIDFGCGSGYKLNKYLNNLGVKVYGVDQYFAVDEGKKMYPSINWIEDDFAHDRFPQYDEFDVIVSADVVEHLVNPDKLIDRILRSSHKESVIFISTPERDLVRGASHYGPPGNPKHVREWNFVELEEYLRSRGLEILNHVILPAKKLTIIEGLRNAIGKLSNRTCQMVICKPK